MNSDEILRRNVTRLREERGWSVQELANKIGIDRTYLSKAEHGQRSFKVDEINQMAKAFGVSTDYLLGNDTPKADPHPYDLADDEPLTYQGVELPDDLRIYYKSMADAYVKQHHKGDDDNG